MEDILSLDDKVINKIYEDQIPEVRRVPAILVMKIKKEILSYLECIEADGAHVFRLEDEGIIFSKNKKKYSDGLTNSSGTPL